MRKLINKARFWLAYASDTQRHQIDPGLKGLYREIFFNSMLRLGSPPNIFDGGDYNNKIKWLMIYDQGHDSVLNADKLAVRQFVRETVGETYLNTLYESWDSAQKIEFETLPKSFALKTNNDSGSVWLVRDKSDTDVEALRGKAAESLKRTYGVGKGESCYRYIQPQAFAEELLSSPASGIPDYKFHCTAGEVRFLQYVSDRAPGQPREKIVRPDGISTDLRLDYDFLPNAKFKKPECWQEIISVSRALSASFKYARVDLYVSKVGVRFGELTFYPRNGNYHGPGQTELGNWLPIDRSTPRFYDLTERTPL